VKKNDVVQAELISREPRKKSIEKTNKQDEWWPRPPPANEILQEC
jgi:hypothetical protein